jgi:hypothetical protein
MPNRYEGRFFAISLDPRNAPFDIALQRSPTGNFVNFSLQADGNFGISINGSLAAIPQLSQVAAIIQGILGVFGLSQAAPEPPAQLKTITLDPGVTLATLFGASQGIAFLVQVLRGKVQQVKNYINSAVTSIKNLFDCLLKNPLLAATLIAKLIRQGWIKLPPVVREALEQLRDVINKTIGLNIIIYNPIADFLKKLREWLQFKWPPPILLPFIPFIPGCSPAFYSGRPPSFLLDRREITAEVEPQFITRPGGFTSRVTFDVPEIPLEIGPGRNPDLSLTDEQVQNLLGSYDPYNLNLAGILPVDLNEDLQRSTNFPLSPGGNSSVRQVQDRLISASNSLVNNITALNKDVSRAGLAPRSSPLDDLLCKPTRA